MIYILQHTHIYIHIYLIISLRVCSFSHNNMAAFIITVPSKMFKFWKIYRCLHYFSLLMKSGDFYVIYFILIGPLNLFWTASVCAVIHLVFCSGLGLLFWCEKYPVISDNDISYHLLTNITHYPLPFSFFSY